MLAIWPVVLLSCICSSALDVLVCFRKSKGLVTYPFPQSVPWISLIFSQNCLVTSNFKRTTTDLLIFNFLIVDLLIVDLLIVDLLIVDLLIFDLFLFELLFLF